MMTLTHPALSTQSVPDFETDDFEDDADMPEKKEEVTNNKIHKSTLRDLHSLGVLNKMAYIALNLRLDQPINGQPQSIDTDAYATLLTFTDVMVNGKEKTFEISSSDVESAIATLKKKGALQCDKPPVQLSIGLMY
jgi:hypothetical protein